VDGVGVGLRLFYFLLLLFVGGWIAAFRPYEVIGGGEKKEPRVVLERFAYKEFDSGGVRIVIKGRRGWYNKEILRIDMPVARDANGSEKIWSDYGEYNGSLLDLQGHVRYVRLPYKFFGHRVLYDTATKILNIPTRFTLRHRDFNVTGSELFYWKKSGKIEGRNVNAKALFR
jgi:hypothetical protein